MAFAHHVELITPAGKTCRQIGKGVGWITLQAQTYFLVYQFQRFLGFFPKIGMAIQ